MPMKTIRAAMKDADYDVGKSTLARHVASLEAGGTPFKDEKATGAEAKLSAEQWEIVAGAILAAEEKVGLFWVQRFVLQNFNVEYQNTSVSDHVAQLQLSFKLAASRTHKPGVTHETYVQGYTDYCLDLCNRGFWDHEGHTYWCVDSVTNSQRCERQKTIGLIGGKQKKLARPGISYTDNNIVAVSRDGLKMLWTLNSHNPVFDPNGVWWPWVEEKCVELGLPSDKIYYYKSKRHYCAESYNQLWQFQNVFRKELKGGIIIHDGGPAYKKDGHNVFDEVAYMTETLPSVQHGELSALDHGVNAPAKALWVSERIKVPEVDHAYESLLLGHCLHKIGSDNIAEAWKTNFMMSVKKLTFEAVERQLNHVHGKVPKRMELYNRYIAAYEDHLDGKGHALTKKDLNHIESSLDGVYWTN